MAYNKKTWKARLGQGLNKFSIDGATPVPIINQPDSVTQQGDALSAGNLNDLEQRIADAFDDVEESKADKSTTNALQSQINQHDARLENLEQKAGDYSIVQYRGTDAVPTGKAKYGLVEKIVGKTRAWNQLVDTDTSSVTLISGHKYLTVINGSFSIVTGAGTAISVTGGTDCVYDLTLIFGDGNEPATVADALTALPALGQYNSYDAGSLVSTTVEGVESDSRNLFDKTQINDTTYGTPTIDGEKISVTGAYYCSWDIDLDAGEYYLQFTVVSYTTARGVRFKYEDGTLKDTITSSGPIVLAKRATSVYLYCGGSGSTGTSVYENICINKHDSLDGTFTPFFTDTLSLPTPFTGRSAGTVADTDELNVEVNGVARRRQIQRIGSVDLGSLDWTVIAQSEGKYNMFQSSYLDNRKTASANILTGRYVSTINQQNLNDKQICPTNMTNSITVCVRDDSFNSDADAFKTAMDGVMLNYELATPVVTLSDPIPDNFIEVEGGGTVETIQTQTPVIDNCLDVGYLTV